MPRRQLLSWRAALALPLLLQLAMAQSPPPSTTASPPPAAVSPPPAQTPPPSNSSRAPPPPATATLTTLGKYDPCTPLGLATRGSGFYVGVAFWPGHTVEEWGLRYNTTSREFGLNPCNATVDPLTETSHRAYLAANGAVFGSFEAKVDTMTALKFNAADIFRVYNQSLNATALMPPVLSAIIFRSGIRSEARYIVSADAGASYGVGAVTTLAVGASFRTGALQSFTWDDVTCDQCGGLTSSECIQTRSITAQVQHSCTLPIATCNMNNNCTLAVYTGFSGSDKHGTTLSTATQIHQINQYSASTLYYNIKNNVANILNNAQSGTLGGSTAPSSTTGGVA